jgi:uncharacterized protein YbjT (DUF2867 family)
MRMLKWMTTAAAVAMMSFGVASAADKGTVVVVGGGQSGAPTARILVEQGYDVRVMVRDPARAKGLPETASVVAGDATKPETLAEAFKGADYVISTIGANCVPNTPYPAGAGPADVDYKGVANMADAAKAAGVKQFVLMSSIGAGSVDPKDRLNEMCGMVLEWKGKGEDHLRQAGIDYTIVRPGGLRPFPGQPECKEGVEGLRVWSPKDASPPGAICRADVGLVMIHALGNAEAIGKTINVVGDKNAAAVDGWKNAWAEIAKD